MVTFQLLKPLDLTNGWLQLKLHQVQGMSLHGFYHGPGLGASLYQLQSRCSPLHRPWSLVAHPAAGDGDADDDVDFQSIETSRLLRHATLLLALLMCYLLRR